MIDSRLLDQRLSESIEKLKALGIPLSDHIFTHARINDRAKKRLGCCIYRDGSYTIEIASFLLEDEKNEDMLMDTIYHELLHTCPGCINHGKEWKYYAGFVNTALARRIQRTAELTEQEGGSEYPYMLVCSSCKMEIGRMRMSRVVKNPERYLCAKCGGKLVRAR